MFHKTWIAVWTFLIATLLLPVSGMAAGYQEDTEESPPQISIYLPKARNAIALSFLFKKPTKRK